MSCANARSNSSTSAPRTYMPLSITRPIASRSSALIGACCAPMSTNGTRTWLVVAFTYVTSKKCSRAPDARDGTRPRTLAPLRHQSLNETQLADVYRRPRLDVLQENEIRIGWGWFVHAWQHGGQCQPRVLRLSRSRDGATRSIAGLAIDEHRHRPSGSSVAQARADRRRGVVEAAQRRVSDDGQRGQRLRGRDSEVRTVGVLAALDRVRAARRTDGEGRQQGGLFRSSERAARLKRRNGLKRSPAAVGSLEGESPHPTGSRVPGSGIDQVESAPRLHHNRERSQRRTEAVHLLGTMLEDEIARQQVYGVAERSRSCLGRSSDLEVGDQHRCADAIDRQ